MKQLWAPWRIQYIQMAKADGCILCDKPKENNDVPNYILHRGNSNFVIMNSYPYNAGHLMIAPYRHLSRLDELTDAELHEHYEIVRQCVTVIREVFHPDAFNIGMNMGRVAGAGIDDHIHSHIVPRWNGDTNFMPILADIKVINEALSETYQKLKPKF